MSVLRKSLSLSITLSLILSSSHLWADDSDYLTPYSFNREAHTFCAKAPGMMEKLNKDNQENIEKVEALKAKIESLNSEMAIINGVDAIKKQYESSLQAIVDNQSSKYENLTNMKSVIRNGLLINAIGLLLKNSPLDKDEMFKVSNICKNADNEKRPICKKRDLLPSANPSQRGYINFFGQHPLDKPLEQFRLAFKQVEPANQEQLKENVQKIIDSIPKDIAPDAIFDILDSVSPGLTSLLASEKSKETLMKCLDEKSSKSSLEECEKVLPEFGNLSEKLTKQTMNATAALKTHSAIIGEASRSNIVAFNNELVNFSQKEQQQQQQTKFIISQVAAQTKSAEDAINDTNLKSRGKADSLQQSTRARKIENSKRKESNLSAVAVMFYEPNYDGVDDSQIEDKTTEAIALANRKALQWKDKCMNPNITIDIGACQKEMKEISAKVNAKKIDYQNRLVNLQNEIKRIDLDDEQRFSKLETLKRFVAEKFLRTCAKKPEITMKKEKYELGISVDGVCYSGIQTLSTLEGLGNDVSNIIRQTKFAQDITGKKIGAETFSLSELKDFQSVCSIDSYSTSYKDICSQLKNEKKPKDTEKEKKDWDKFYEENWVSYSDSSPKGYSAVKKKTTGRILAEGILPVVPTMIPMLFSNFAMSYSIDMLTNQGLYQKQMFHNIDAYNTSPWMYNYNYFGTGLSTTSTTSTGFNFGP